jgi:hypothetical protein
MPSRTVLVTRLPQIDLDIKFVVRAFRFHSPDYGRLATGAYKDPCVHGAHDYAWSWRFSPTMSKYLAEGSRLVFC